MKQKIKEKINETITSRKFWAMIAAIGTALANDTEPGIAMSAATTNLVIGALAAYLLGQGIADSGKEKAKIESAAKSRAKSKR